MSTALLADAIKALRWQATFSAMQKESLPLATDPRYTPFLGEWDGYDTPESRYYIFAHERRDLRAAVLARAKEAGL